MQISFTERGQGVDQGDDRPMIGERVYPVGQSETLGAGKSRNQPRQQGTITALCFGPTVSTKSPLASL